MPSPAVRIIEHEIFGEDDLVIFKPELHVKPELRGKVYRVSATPAPRAMKVDVVGSDGKNYLLKLEHITRASADTVWTGPAPVKAPDVFLGTVVILNATFKVRGAPADEKYVVLAHVGTSKVRLAPLNGNDDRYVTGVPKTALIVITV